MFTGLLCLVLFTGASAYAKKEFPEWSLEVYSEVKRIVDKAQGEPHGAIAFARLYDVWMLINVYLNDPVEVQLEEVNDYMNALTWVADIDLWKQTDYWATPFETLTTFGGDCEDIAIAKYAVLQLMGVPAAHMGFAHVVTSQREHHMVMVYRASEKEDVMILDNQHPDVKSAKERADLIAVYVFQDKADDTGNVSIDIIKDQGNAQRTLKSRKENHRLKKWLEVKERSRKNIEILMSFNEGRPLLPDWASN